MHVHIIIEIFEAKYSYSIRVRSFGYSNTPNQNFDHQFISYHSIHNNVAVVCRPTLLLFFIDSVATHHLYSGTCKDTLTAKKPPTKKQLHVTYKA